MSRPKKETGKRILVVDDEMNDLRLIYENLKDYYKTDIAINVDSALQIVSGGAQLHFILSDLVMTKERYNGIDLIRILKGEDSAIPIIAMSSLATPENSARAIKEGAIYFVNKDDIKAPQDGDVLIKKVHDIEDAVKEYHNGRNEMQKLRMKAFHDDITQLYNRHKFEMDINAELSRHSRRIRRGPDGSVFSLLYIDINDMKLANDSLGHSYVDRNLLANLGTIILHGHRNIDSGYRIGGDEFIIILPDTD